MTVSDEAEAALVREFIAPRLPGDAFDAPAKPNRSDIEPAFVLMASDEWTPVQAVWLLAAGTTAPGPRSVRHRLVQKMLETGEEDWSDNNVPEDVGVFAAVAAAAYTEGGRQSWPKFRHHWIRFAVQEGLPITFAFWHTYFEWKAACWSLGNEMATLHEDDLDQAKREGRSPYGMPSMPVEAYWHLHHEFEAEFASQMGSATMIFRFHRRLELQQLELAVIDARRTIQVRAASLVGSKSRLRRVGAENMKRIRDAVHLLAERHGLEREPSGRFYFGGKRHAWVIERIKEIDNGLKEVGDEAFRRALPKFVRGKRGQRTTTE